MARHISNALFRFSSLYLLSCQLELMAHEDGCTTAKGGRKTLISNKAAPLREIQLLNKRLVCTYVKAILIWCQSVKEKHSCQIRICEAIFQHFRLCVNQFCQFVHVIDVIHLNIKMVGYGRVI